MDTEYHDVIRSLGPLSCHPSAAISSCFSMIMHSVARICTQILDAENVPVPEYSPDMSPKEHVWDALDRCIRQRIPVPVNIQLLHTAIEKDGTTFHRPQSSLIKSMRRRCVVLHEANGGHTGY
jgi:hypothetical protein